MSRSFLSYQVDFRTPYKSQILRKSRKQIGCNNILGSTPSCSHGLLGNAGNYFNYPISAQSPREHLSIIPGRANQKITLISAIRPVGERSLFHYMTPLSFYCLFKQPWECLQVKPLAQGLPPPCSRLRPRPWGIAGASPHSPGFGEGVCYLDNLGLI